MHRRGNGSHPVHRLRDEMDRLFQDFMGTESPMASWWGGGYPALNIWEDENSVYAEAELPGLGMEDVEVLVVGDELTIKGERKSRAESEELAYHRRERGIGPFARTVQLPVHIDSDKVDAVFTNGVLNVTMPKAETAKPRKIPVHTA